MLTDETNKLACEQMRVLVYNVNAYGERTLEHFCSLLDCWGGQPDDECLQALVKLREDGETFVGGGAAPLTLLVNWDEEKKS